MTSTAESPTTKIVIVSGQEFTVPVDTTIEDLRQHLSNMFPDVMTATVLNGRKRVGDQEYETIEFVKRAGTKGSTNLAPLLDDIPALRLTPPRASTLILLQRLRQSDCTFAEVLDADLRSVLATLPESSIRVSGVTLCAQLDLLPPVAGAAESAW